MYMYVCRQVKKPERDETAISGCCNITIINILFNIKLIIYK